MDWLEELGWREEWDAARGEARERRLLCGRVVGENRLRYEVLGEDREAHMARVPGRMRRRSESRADLPVVGDWVLLRPGRSGPATVERLLPRRTRLARGEAGRRTREQLLAANVDVVFVVTSLNEELNLRRLERYLAMVLEEGIEPVVVLNKADLTEDPAAAEAAVREVSGEAAVLRTAALAGEGVEELRARVPPGRTAVLLGSSGVGKSTLVNQLLGEELLDVQEIRQADARGRHTTSARHLLRVPGGGMILDTPGLREVQLLEADEGLENLFAEIWQRAGDCRFSDCVHEEEPGCAVREALEAGELDPERVASWRKLRRELEERARRQEERRWRRRAGRNRPGSEPEPDEPI